MLTTQSTHEYIVQINLCSYLSGMYVKQCSSLVCNSRLKTTKSPFKGKKKIKLACIYVIEQCITKQRHKPQVHILVWLNLIKPPD